MDVTSRVADDVSRAESTISSGADNAEEAAEKGRRGVVAAVREDAEQAAEEAKDAGAAQGSGLARAMRTLPTIWRRARPP